MATSEEALPVLDPVQDYEKIKRIGEGTFGVVCESYWGSGDAAAARPPSGPCTVHQQAGAIPTPQTRRATGGRGRLWR